MKGVSRSTSMSCERGRIKWILVAATQAQDERTLVWARTATESRADSMTSRMDICMLSALTWFDSSLERSRMLLITA